MFLLAGLGNPGKEYARTRHNTGEMALGEIIHQYDLRPIGEKFDALAWKGRIHTHEVLAIFPQTYMNRSGISVAQAARFYRIAPAEVIVLYDDLDLAPAKFRARIGGGNGGHNGLKDIDRAIGAEYWRLRIGIGRPEHKSAVTSYVLGAFTEREKEALQPLFRSLSTHLPLLLAGSADKLMSAVAQDMQPLREQP